MLSDKEMLDQIYCHNLRQVNKDFFFTYYYYFFYYTYMYTHLCTWTKTDNIHVTTGCLSACVNKIGLNLPVYWHRHLCIKEGPGATNNSIRIRNYISR